MSALPVVSEVRLRPGTEEQLRGGLVGFLKFRLGDVIVDGATLRRSADGRMLVSFPEKVDGLGIRRPYVIPIDQAARSRIEAAIFAALGIEPGGAR